MTRTLRAGVKLYWTGVGRHDRVCGSRTHPGTRAKSPPRAATHGDGVCAARSVNEAPSAMQPRIPFNKPFIAGKELYYIAQAVTFGQLAGDGHFTKACASLLEER